ncbi:hypothetical protein CHS0354_035511 [Potamilus streckersoni]|uniref:Mitochondria-eating protein n=1 Tax=Potamilus streckersoni TaxID=2493646 RepID=A0AAE0RVI7_9BIVA|nr:hypothetical protein CHS0354_035511 [Potamilus streckersoni]
MGSVNGSFNPEQPGTHNIDVARKSDGIVPMTYIQTSGDIKDDYQANQPSNANTAGNLTRNLSDPVRINDTVETQTYKQPIRLQDQWRQEHNVMQLSETRDGGTVSRPIFGRDHEETKRMKQDKKKKVVLGEKGQQVKEGRHGFRTSTTDISYRSRKREKDYKKTIARLEAEVRQLRKENQTLLTRLSEIGSYQFTENNPNVADLSDANRPQKLADQFSELYDNEWTDAFEHLSEVDDSPEEETVRRLLNILQKIYAICLESTRKKDNDLRDKIVAYIGVCDEEKDEFVVMEKMRNLGELRLKNLEKNIDLVTKDVRQQVDGQPHGNLHESLYKYIDRCIRLCWLMSIKRPEMHIDFGDNPRYEGECNGGNKVPSLFDMTKFRSYTRIGMYVDYIVWPALYLYKDGPIIRKGVAQGLEKNAVLTEFTENE